MVQNMFYILRTSKLGDCVFDMSLCTVLLQLHVVYVPVSLQVYYCVCSPTCTVWTSWKRRPSSSGGRTSHRSTPGRERLCFR